MTVGDFWKRLVGFGAPQSEADWIVIQDPAFLDTPEKLPWELRYVLSLRPSRHAKVSDMLKRFGLGFVFHRSTPNEVTKAVRRISDLTQENLSHHWLERLIKHGQDPVWTIHEAKDAEAQGIDLADELETVKEFKKSHCRFALVKFSHQDSTEADMTCLQDMNDDLSAVAAPWLLNLLREKLMTFKFPVVGICLMVLIVMAPFVFWLNDFNFVLMFIAAVGASGYLVLNELFSASMRLYNDRRRRKELFWLMGVWFASIVPAVFVTLSIDSGNYVLSGLLFALAVTVMPAYFLTRSFLKVVNSWRKLTVEGKTAYSGDLLPVIVYQEKGLLVRLIGLLVSFLFTVWLFVVLRETVLVGFWLAILACLPYVFAESAGWLEVRSAKAAYMRSLKRLWRRAIILTSGAW